MGYLSGLMADTQLWQWDDTTQRSFEEVKKIVGDHRDQRQEALNYVKGAPPIWVTTDVYLTGGGGYVSQGTDPSKAKVMSFWLGKWNAAQQNYPVHEQELLALIETLKRFRGILHGTMFTVQTDHKALTHLMRQKDLSPWQHHWLDILIEFNFNIEYIPGDTNEFADTLSRIYSNDPKGVVRADSEYVTDLDEPFRGIRGKTHPIYVDMTLIPITSTTVCRSSRLASKPGINYSETSKKPKKVDWLDKSPTVVQEFPDKVQSDNESTGSEKTMIDDELQDIPNVQKQLEDTRKLFRTIESQDEWFPECLKGRYGEDPDFKHILDNSTELTNFEIKEGLIFFRSEGIMRLAILNVKIGD